MKKIATSLIALALCAIVAAPALSANAVRINQVFGGNGAANAYQADFVELFNSSSVPVNIGGWSIQYGSASTTTGFGTFSVYQLPADAVIPACGYYLVQFQTGALGITPDASSTAVNLSGSNGKIALTNAAPVALPCLGNSYTPPAGVQIIDAVAYGVGAGLCWEGTGAAGALSTFTMLQRKLSGMQDTDDNAADFLVIAAPGTLHNSASPSNPDCLVTPVTPGSWGRIKTIYR